MDPPAAEAVGGKLRRELTGRSFDPNDPKGHRGNVLVLRHTEPNAQPAADMKMPGARKVECDHDLVEAVRVGRVAVQDLEPVDADSPRRIAAEYLQSRVGCGKEALHGRCGDLR